jgi:AraC family transcriptional activator of pobA
MAQKNITNYDGLYGDTSAQYSSEYIFLELIETRSLNFDWVIHPHIHTNLFQVFIVENGEVNFQEITQQHQVKAPCVLLIPPTQLHGLVYTPDVRGYILTVSSSIIEDIFKTFSDTFKLFTQTHILTHFNEEISFETIKYIIQEIQKELFSEQAERSIMLRAYLIQFFVCFYRMSRQGEEINNNNISMTYFRKFQQSIKRSDYPKSIPAFADELNITAVHLNRICKAMAGKSAIELVHQNLIGEAQKYLLHTSYSISEISFLLKFEYPNYFAKLFKKYVGIAPNEYRKQDRK